MKISKIDISILKLLINHETLSLEQITFFLNVSVVTARNSIKNINSFLKFYNFGKIIKSNKDYYLSLTTDSFDIPDSNFKVVLNSEERISYIIILLIFEKKINLNSLTDIFHVTRNTLNNDLLHIKKFLKKFNLSLKSISWQGILLKGNYNDIKEFSIKYLVKILIKKEFNEIIWTLYGKFLNPLVKKYFENFIMPKLPINLKLLQQQIITNLNLELGVYLYEKIECMLIYHFIFYDDICENFYLNIDSLPENSKNDFDKIYFSLSEIKEFKTLDLKVFQSLVVSLLTITDEYIYTTCKDLAKPIFDRVEEIYSVTLNKKELTLLSQILGNAYFKFDFSIVSYSNYFITDYDIPKSVITDVKYTLKKKKVTLLEEDYYTLAIYLYDTICTRYKTLDIDVKFLIIDSSFKNWLGYELKKEFLKHLSFLKIDILSIFNYSTLDNSLIEKYDYILFTNYIDKKTLLKKNPELEDKIYYVKYNDFFEVNNLWGQLFFGPGGEKSLPFIKRKLNKYLT